jgi:hypothetical protein
MSATSGGAEISMLDVFADFAADDDVISPGINSMNQFQCTEDSF